MTSFMIKVYPALWIFSISTAFEIMNSDTTEVHYTWAKDSMTMNNLFLENQ